MSDDERAESNRLERVLLVDDEPLVREVVSRTLQAEGYVVVEASNGFDAINLARKTQRRP